MVSPFRIELRRSPMLYAAPLLVLVGVAIYADRDALGEGQWPDVLSALNWSLVLLGPLAAGMAAWIGGREKRRGMQPLRVTSTKRGSAIVMPQLLAAIVWVEAAVAIIVAYAMTVHIYQGIWGAPSALWLFKIAIGAASFVPAPFALGWIVARRFVPPLVAVTSFVGMGLIVSYFRVQWLYVLLPLPATSGTIWLRINSTVMVGQTLWLAAVAVIPIAVLAVWLDRTPRSTLHWRQVAAPATAIVAATVGVLLIVGQHSRIYTSEFAQYTPVCVSDGVPVCGHPAYSSQLPEVSARAELLQARLDGTPGQFDSLVQRLAPGDPPIGGGAAPSFAISSARAGFADLAITRLVTQSFMTECGGTKDPSIALPLQRAVAGWLASSSTDYLAEFPAGVPDAVSSALRAFNSLSEQSRRAWLRENYASVEQCGLSTQMFG